jgi:hypothetical protein
MFVAGREYTTQQTENAKERVVLMKLNKPIGAAFNYELPCGPRPIIYD